MNQSLEKKELANQTSIIQSKNSNTQESIRQMYVLVPEFTDKTEFNNFFIVLTGFLFMMVGYIYAANYNNEYIPNFSMLIDFLIDNNSVSQNKFRRYINDIVENENFTVSDLKNQNTSNKILPITKNIKKPTSFFEKIKIYINSFITKTFYVKNNTLHVKVT